MKDFLSKEMSKNRNFDTPRAKDFSIAFSRATKAIVSNLDKPFRPRGLLNAATLEAVMVSLMEKNTEISRERYDLLLQNQSFKDAIFANTSSIDSVKSRKIIADKILFGHE